MRLTRLIQQITDLSLRHRRAVVAAVALLAAAGATYATFTLRPTVALDTVVDRSSPVYQANQRVEQAFGEEAAVVLVRGQLTKLVLTSNLGRLIGLEGCISGNAPKKAKLPGGIHGPCAQLARLHSVHVVYGPGTFINEAARQLGKGFGRRLRSSQKEVKQAAEAARKLAAAQGKPPAEQERLAKAARQLAETEFLRDTLKLASQYGLTNVPRVNDPRFVSELVFESAQTFGTPKARFAYLFPNSSSALIQVRLKPGLSGTERKRTLELIERAVAMSRWKLKDATYTVTGAPLVIDRVTDQLTRSLLSLLAIAVLVMAVVLAVVFRRPARLLPLVLALATVAIVCGLFALAGISLTVAVIAALPILIGLSIDYVVQFQSRRGEGGGGSSLPGTTTIVIAGLASTTSFLALLLSPIPMVRDFGLLLIVGVLIALLIALVVGVAALSLLSQRESRDRQYLGRLTASLSSRVRPLIRAWRGALEILGEWGATAIKATTRRPKATVVVALLLAVVGWSVDSRVGVETDIKQLIPSDQPALKKLEYLQATTGSAGTVEVLVEGRKLTDPRVISWLQGLRTKTLKRFGANGKKGCGQTDLCAGVSFADLFPSGGKQVLSGKKIAVTLRNLPPYYARAVLSPDRKSALLTFGMRLVPAERQRQIIAWLKANLDLPPGITATVTGLPAFAAQASGALSSPVQRFGALALALLLILSVLLLAFGRPRCALIPLVPIIFATGWTVLLLFLFGIPLNPLSATLGALVVAITTEFSVLLSERYRVERQSHGQTEWGALVQTYKTTGSAVLVSGVTAITGFAVLVASDIPLIRDFGLVTVLDLSASLVGVLIVLPALFMLTDDGTSQPPQRDRAE